MIIFYDAQCPLCNTEMEHLKKSDTRNQLKLEDLNSAGFSERFPDIDKKKAMNLLHAKTDTGDMIYGLDVTYQAWRTVGKYRWLRILRLPIIKIAADAGYTFFAKHRQLISRILMPHKACNSDQCNIKQRRSDK